MGLKKTYGILWNLSKKISLLTAALTPPPRGTHLTHFYPTEGWGEGRAAVHRLSRDKIAYQLI